MRKSHLLTLALLFGTAVAQAQMRLMLHTDQAKAEVSPRLYGLMTEEINFSYDGGLYSQLVRNPSFRDGYKYLRQNELNQRFGDVELRTNKYWWLRDSTAAVADIDRTVPVNAANPWTLKFEVKDAGRAALVNDGYWGFPIRGNTTYTGGLFVKTDKPGTGLTIALMSSDGSRTFAKTTVTGIANELRKVSYTLQTGSDAPDTKDAKLVITASGKANFWLGRVTLFPPLYKGLPLRADLMEMMRAMRPKFLRLPGGNYLEGNEFRNRFDWKKTIGDPDKREGHYSPWGYPSTDGMGLLEFLQWAEALEAEPVLGLFAGYCLNRDYVEGPFLEPFIQDALDEIEYVMGSTDTKWGARRAADGHPEPFPLRFVEIGNEDGFDHNGSYTMRYKQFYDAIRKAYPQLEIICTTGESYFRKYPREGVVPKVDIVDEHGYRSAKDMFRQYHRYDRYDRKGVKVFAGEWATREGVPTTNMNAALGDAVWMAGVEKNSDVVIMSCYAPLFVNVNPLAMQWRSNLIGYDALSAYGSPSYYAQVMFGGNVGDRIVPVTEADVPTMSYYLNETDSVNGKKTTTPSVFHSATLDSKSGKVYLKLINPTAEARQVAVEIPGRKLSKVEKTELKAANPQQTNTVTAPRNIVPQTSKVRLGKGGTVTLPPYSIAVYTLK